MRRAFLKVFAVGFVAGCVSAGAAQAQAPAFGDIAGKWEGTTSSGNKIELGIGPTGAFAISAPRGSDSGVAKIDGNQVVMAFTKNAGSVTVSKSGDSLQGTMAMGAISSPITFSRKK